MKKTLTTLFALVAMAAGAVTPGTNGVFFFAFPQTNAISTNDIFLVAHPDSTGTNWSLFNVPLAVIESSLPPSSATATNAAYCDPDVALFCISNGLPAASQGARDLAIGASWVKRLGAWTNFQDAVMFHSDLAPSNHLSFFQHPWSYTNEVYTPWGMGPMQFSNTVTFALPYALSNCTLVFNYRSSAAFLEMMGSGGFDSQYAVNGDLLDLMSTNDGSSIIWSGFSGVGLFARASQGANYGYNITNMLNNQNVRLWPMANGYFDFRNNHAAVTPTVIALSLKNGLMRIFWNGNPVEFCNSYGGGAGAQTNVYAFPAASSAFNVFHGGGGNTNWTGKQLDAIMNYYGTNGYGAELGSVSFWNCSVDDNPAILRASYAFARSIEPFYNQAVALQGGSLMVKTAVKTNGLAYVASQAYPNVLFLDEAEEAAALSTFNSCVLGWTNNIKFGNVALTWLPPEKYISRTVKTEAPRNDTGSVTPANEALSFQAFYTNYLTAGCQVELIKTHYAPGFGAGGGYYESGLGAMFAAIETNFPLAASWNEAAYMPLEYLTNVSQDTPPVHLDAGNIGAQIAMKSWASLIMGNGWTTPWQGPIAYSEMYDPSQTITPGQVAAIFTNTSSSSGFVGGVSNLLWPSAISFPASGSPWTNNTGRNIVVLIDNYGVSQFGQIQLNGATIAQELGSPDFLTLPLQPGEFFSEDYSGTTPSARIKPQ